MAENTQIVVGQEVASLADFVKQESELEGLVYDPRLACMKQIKDHLLRKNPTWKPKAVKARAEFIVHVKLRAYTDALLAHLGREYNLELPRFSKKTGPDGQPNSFSLRGTRKPVKPMTEDQVIALYRRAQNGDVAAVKQLNAGGILLPGATAEPEPVREAEIVIS